MKSTVLKTHGLIQSTGHCHFCVPLIYVHRDHSKLNLNKIHKPNTIIKHGNSTVALSKQDKDEGIVIQEESILEKVC